MANDHSISTDSEESFLVKQINRSQFFNSSTSSSSHSSKKRRSFFRESFIDENGADRSFNVYHDAILEDHDESKEVSNISKLSNNIDLERARSMNSSRGNILAELNLNKTVDSFHDKSSGSRSNSLSRKPSLRMTPRPTEQRSESRQSESPTVNSYPPIIDIREDLNKPAISAPEPPEAIADIISAYGDDEHTSKIQEPKRYIDDSPPIPKPFKLQPMSIDKERSPSNSSSRTFRSAKSDRSSRPSLLSYEMTRKKQAGTPHVLLQPTHTNSLHGLPHGSLPPGSLPNEIPKLPTTAPASTKLHSDSVDKLKSPQLSQQPRTLRSTDYPKRGPDILKTLQVREIKFPKLENGSPDSSFSIYDDEKDVLDGVYLGKNFHYNDDLLEKIYYYRAQRSDMQGERSTFLIWFIFLISFLIPPLFFFLGFGLLDRYISRHTISPGIKRLSLITGFLVLIVSLAMIGVGFGYGIHAASAR
jgi:hypothetical protein